MSIFVSKSVQKLAFHKNTRTVGIPNLVNFSRNLSLKPDFSKLKMTPPPPGGVIGDVNQAFKPPAMNMFHGSYHWVYERITAATILPLASYSIFTVATGGEIHPLVDAVMAATGLFYLQFEFSSCITDYIQKRRFHVWHKICKGMLYAGTFVGLCGIYELETNDNGVVQCIVKFISNDDSNLYIFGR